MKDSPGLSHDTKLLSCSTRNTVKVPLKGHLSIKRHHQYYKLGRQTNSAEFHPESMGLTGDELCVTRRLSLSSSYSH